MWKIIQTDNYARETVAEKLVAENIKHESYANLMCSALQENPKRGDCDWYRVVPQDYVLWRGMEEFV